MQRAGNTRSTLDSIASPSWELSHNHTHTEQVIHVLDECSIRGLNDVYVPASGAVIHRQEVPVRMTGGGGGLDNTFCAPSQQVLAFESNKIKPLVLEKSELHYSFQGIIHEIITHDIPV